MNIKRLVISALIWCLFPENVAGGPTLVDCLTGPGTPASAACVGFDTENSDLGLLPDGEITLRDFIRTVQTPLFLSGLPCFVQPGTNRFYITCETSTINSLEAVKADFNYSETRLCGENTGNKPLAFSIANIGLFSRTSIQAQIQAGYGRWRGVPDRPIGVGPQDVFIAAYFEALAINRQFGTELLHERLFVNFTSIASETQPNTFEIIDGRDLGSINTYFCSVNGVPITFLDNSFFVTSGRVAQFSTECVNAGDLALGSPGEPVEFEAMAYRTSGFFGSDIPLSSNSCLHFGPRTRLDLANGADHQLDSIWKNRIAGSEQAGSRIRFWDRRNLLN
jgi:hypothetical protein